MIKRNCIQKRSLLYGPKTSTEDLIRYGEEYLTEAALADALAFFVRAGHVEGVRRVLEESIRQGDAFLLEQIRRTGEEGGGWGVTPEEWRRAAARAEGAGKLRFAARAYRAAGDEDAASRIEEGLRGGGGDGNAAPQADAREPGARSRARSEERSS